MHVGGAAKNNRIAALLRSSEPVCSPAAAITVFTSLAAANTQLFRNRNLFSKRASVQS